MVAGLGNEGLGAISLSEGRKADKANKALPLWIAPQPPIVRQTSCVFLWPCYK